MSVYVCVQVCMCVSMKIYIYKCACKSVHEYEYICVHMCEWAYLGHCVVRQLVGVSSLLCKSWDQTRSQVCQQLSLPAESSCYPVFCFEFNVLIK